MSDKTIAEKLYVKNAATIAVLNADARHAFVTGQLPAEKLVDSGPADLVLLFVHASTELEALLPQARTRLAPKGALWVAYLKGTSKSHAAGLHRDTIRTFAATLGLDSVAMIALDADWSALRLKA
ncbi:Protein of unknown function (DUF3052) [Pseudoduganella lurida]|uniref:DUF3052 family protein n=1 Tax=Pseudoduganella lurida TaxID=1036180 RepID=A0A562R5C2_9BURK|nr:DUF3052 family protein [Pseudoduganella lurida]TWI64269.1 Protein of unknown function (DUF3052) [Pseudoduganella lurida]